MNIPVVFLTCVQEDSTGARRIQMPAQPYLDAHRSDDYVGRDEDPSTAKGEDYRFLFLFITGHSFADCSRPLRPERRFRPPTRVLSSRTETEGEDEG